MGGIGGIASICFLALTVAAPAFSGSTDADVTRPPPRDYVEIVAAIDATMRAHHYDPVELETPEYRRVAADVRAMAELATSDPVFLDGFRTLWSDGPFSHVTLDLARQSADQLATYLDTMRVGGDAVTLAWHDSVAVLTVKTMMGLDTIEAIDAAYDELASRDAAALVIDLRENGGGAFAVRPLVAHLISEPIDAGVFISQPWNASNKQPPTKADWEAVEPWSGWSVRAFWTDVQTQALVRVQFAPAEPRFDGPVYVLTSRRTASAAELATDALKSAGRATIVGERTAGKMLSQKIYDIPGGFHLSLPIADYYSVEHGRIENVGVAPDIETEASSALEVALEHR